MTMFSGIISEWSEYYFDTNLAEAVHLMELGLDPEPQVQNYEKFHTGVSNAQKKVSANHDRLHDPDTKFKNRKDKRAQLAAHHKRLGQIVDASKVASRFAKASGKDDHADVHTQIGDRLHAMKVRLNTHVQSKRDPRPRPEPPR